MNPLWRLIWTMLAAAALPAFAQEIHGAGATFPAPVYAKWAEAYKAATGISIRYDAVGSGEGIARIRNREVDFGATDVPLTGAELDAAHLEQFPGVIGGVVPVVNIAGVKPGALKLTGAVLAEIYLGHARKWNDKAIADLNPDIALPRSNITVAHRGDASGSSFLWTSYLSDASPEWKSTVGAGTHVAWPAGVAGVGNEGVASYVQRTRFSLGYVEYAYAKAHRLSDAALLDKDGNAVQASADAFRATRWPITGASFILVPTHADRSAAVVAFFDWALHHGQPIAESLDYVPISADEVERIAARWNQRIPSLRSKP